MMAEKRSTVKAAFFDVDALGALRFSASPGRLLGLSPYPYLASVLQQLAHRKVRLGIICTMPAVSAESLSEVLTAAGINTFFDRNLLIFAADVVKKDPSALFHLAAGRAKPGGRRSSTASKSLPSSPGSCLLVSEDSAARGQALAAGWRVAPHPLLAQAVLDGDTLWFVRITVPPYRAGEEWRAALRGSALVPLQVSGEGGRTILAIASGTALAGLANAQFDVQPLGMADDPASSDLYVIRDDEASGSGFLSGSGQFDQLFGPANKANQELLLSTSNEGILIRVPFERSIEEFHFATATHGHNLKLVPDPALLSSEADLRGQSQFEALAAERNLTPAEAALVGQLTDARIQAHLDRYAGNAPLGDAPGTAVNSRHILHAGNQRVTNQLATDLQAIGGSALTVSTHSFTHNGSSYSNVEAQLAGNNSELVLVTAHLDSTAASSPPYNAAGDPAPGADDDGSGIAAVLAAAEVICRLAAAQKPDRTIRFVLFNAEEHGLVGSQAYARDAQAAGAVIEAVYQMDMIGYNVIAPRTCEVHAGYLASAVVQDKSAVVAERLRRLAPIVAPSLGTMQLYLSSPGAADPAEGRSDHAPFQARGYAACVATEDFFVGPGPSAPAEPNPNYHRKTDTFVDLAYAADIARSIVAAAWLTACPNAAIPPQGGSTMSIKIASGSTTPGSTNWQAYGTTGVYLDVDTSAGKFTTTPKYVTSIGGASSHWATTGATSIYSATPTGFRVYVRWSDGSALTTAQANSFQWHINWVGIHA
jgi:bacterial leucyl aminopeptidase